ncbi:MAG: hypothetical protein ACJAWL_003673 [Motiliproteus sp.]|jgi:hypothetical protein
MSPSATRDGTALHRAAFVQPCASGLLSGYYPALQHLSGSFTYPE